jgi:large subunit ribosomal protein L31
LLYFFALRVAIAPPHFFWYAYGMKGGIHPAYFPTARVSCACGVAFAVGSTRESLSVEICSQCHPFYSGADKILDTAGRVERFKSRVAAATERSAAVAKKARGAAKKSRAAARSSDAAAAK